MAEKWQETYNDKVEVYDAFSEYEDEYNRVLKKLLEKCSFKNKEILEIGCGSGKYTKLLAPKCKKYFALEISKQLMGLTKKKCNKMKNIKYINCSAEKIPLNDNSIDVVFASWVLTAMISEEMRKSSVKEILRVLKKGGNIWLFENHWEGEFMDMRNRHKFEFENINKLIKNYGFEISETIDTNFFFPTLLMQKKIMISIFGNNAVKYFKNNHNQKLMHKIVILHRKK
jgi:ubiquinone/menaquinone biosynthesis C-methylase UbiE